MSLPPFNILILDDNVSDATLLSNAFKEIRADAFIYTLSDSRILPAYLDRNSPIIALRAGARPNLLVLEVSMPHYSGLERLRWIRSQPRFNDMIVVMLGSREDPLERARFLDAGADSYFVRPATSGDFLRVAKDMMNVCLLPSSDGALQSS